MYYDTQIIYRTDKTVFSWNGWTYYRTKTGKPKRRLDNVIESVKENDFVSLKLKFEETLGYKVDC